MLSAALPTLQTEIQLALFDALYNGFKQTFTYGPGEVGEEIATKFANKVSTSAAPKIASAINNFVMQADITGSPLGLISPVGPVSGAVAPKSLMLI